jgi:hypothetical protein
MSRGVVKLRVPSEPLLQCSALDDSASYYWKTEHGGPALIHARFGATPTRRLSLLSSRREAQLDILTALP